jgi:hypothetical protein
LGGDTALASWPTTPRLRVTHGPFFGDTTDHECPIDGGVLLCSPVVVRAMMFSEDGPRM